MICEYCKKDCAALGSHLKNSHNITNLKEYYDAFIKRENRLKYQKHILIATGADQTKTEQEIMCEKGYRRIYDCGTLKYKYSKYVTLWIKSKQI